MNWWEHAVMHPYNPKTDDHPIKEETGVPWYLAAQKAKYDPEKDKGNDRGE